MTSRDQTRSRSVVCYDSIPIHRNQVWFRLMEAFMPTPEQLAAYNTALDFAEKQVKSLIECHPDFFPMYTVGGRWRHEGEKWTHWTDGFLGGMMWQFFLRKRDDWWRQKAEHY